MVRTGMANESDEVKRARYQAQAAQAEGAAKSDVAFFLLEPVLTRGMPGNPPQKMQLELVVRYLLRSARAELPPAPP